MTAGQILAEAIRRNAVPSHKPDSTPMSGVIVADAYKDGAIPNLEAALHIIGHLIDIAAERESTARPDFLGEALNSGDGTYRP